MNIAIVNETGFQKTFRRLYNKAERLAREKLPSFWKTNIHESGCWSLVFTEKGGEKDEYSQQAQEGIGKFYW